MPAVEGDRPPSGPLWVHEIKHDGYRLMVRRDDLRVRCFTRPRCPSVSQSRRHTLWMLVWMQSVITAASVRRGRRGIVVGLFSDVSAVIAIAIAVDVIDLDVHVVIFTWAGVPDITRSPEQSPSGRCEKHSM